MFTFTTYLPSEYFVPDPGRVCPVHSVELCRK